MAEGHRQRVYTKLKDDSYFFDYELLETLLFNVYPRIDTSPIARQLIARFSSLKDVFSASVEELMTIPGIGESAAYYLKNIGCCYENIIPRNESFAVKTVLQAKNLIRKRFDGLKNEKVEVFFLDQRSRLTCVFEINEPLVAGKEIDLRSFSQVVNENRPYGVFIAHNHLPEEDTAEILRPSLADDDFIEQMLTCIYLLRIRFFDFIVYRPRDDFFAYRDSAHFCKLVRERGIAFY